MQVWSAAIRPVEIGLVIDLVWGLHRAHDRACREQGGHEGPPPAPCGARTASPSPQSARHNSEPDARPIRPHAARQWTCAAARRRRERAGGLHGDDLVEVEQRRRGATTWPRSRSGAQRARRRPVGHQRAAVTPSKVHHANVVTVRRTTTSSVATPAWAPSPPTAAGSVSSGPAAAIRPSRCGPSPRRARHRSPAGAGRTPGRTTHRRRRAGFHVRELHTSMGARSSPAADAAPLLLDEQRRPRDRLQAILRDRPTPTAPNSRTSPHPTAPTPHRSPPPSHAPAPTTSDPDRAPPPSRHPPHPRHRTSHHPSRHHRATHSPRPQAAPPAPSTTPAPTPTPHAAPSTTRTPKSADATIATPAPVATSPATFERPPAAFVVLVVFMQISSPTSRGPARYRHTRPKLPSGGGPPRRGGAVQHRSSCALDKTCPLVK